MFPILIDILAWLDYVFLSGDSLVSALLEQWFYYIVYYKKWEKKTFQIRNVQYIFVFDSLLLLPFILFEEESVYIRGVSKACLSNHR
jgi:hypothetical protein